MELDIATYWDEYKAKSAKYDFRIDQEWSAFDGLSWETMTDDQRQQACVIAERQGHQQRRLIDSYERNTRGC